MNSLLKVARAEKAIHVLGAILGVLFLSLSLFSQVNTGTISGVVQDSSGALIAGATITIRHVDTGTARTVTSDEGGRYIAPVLPLGNYELQAQQSGFQTEIRKGITLTVGREEVINLTLRVGQQTQSVTVTEAAPLVNTTTAEISGLVAEREVKDLPLNGRSFDNLITLNPGAVNYSALKSGPSVGSGEGAYFTVAGRRPLDNLFLWNGIEYTGASNIGITPGGVSGQLLGIDAVREFNVLTDAYSAEYGERARKSLRSRSPAPMHCTVRSSSFCAIARWTPGTFSIPRVRDWEDRGSRPSSGTNLAARWEVRSKKIKRSCTAVTKASVSGWDFRTWPLFPTTVRAKVFCLATWSAAETSAAT